MGLRARGTLHDQELFMILTVDEKDALSELINIGFGRAANALSILVGQRVLLEAPDVDIYPLDQMTNALFPLLNRNITTIHQVFTGTLAGDLMLIMDLESAAVLVDLLNGGTGNVRTMTASDKETLVETGNILLSAFCGSFGNLLRVHLSFAVPDIRLESIQEMLTSLMIGNQEIQYALIVRIHFRLLTGTVDGYVIIVMGVHSLEALISSMKTEGYIL
jgi:chemotaxis protein CheC